MYQLDEHKLAKHHQTYMYCDTHGLAEYPAPIDQLVEHDPAKHQSHCETLRCGKSSSISAIEVKELSRK
jgi:hypothetical protein